MQANWIIPKNMEHQDTVILYYHGGAYVAGSFKSHGNLVGKIATASKCRALVIEYRLTPEFRYPAQIEDALLAYKWLQSAEGGNFKPKNIILAGDSAGGNLTLITALYLRDHVPKDQLPGGLVVLSPWTNMTGSCDTWIPNAAFDYLPTLTGKTRFIPNGVDPADPRVSPCFANYRDMPPILVQVSSKEQLYHDSILLVKKAQEDGASIQCQTFDGVPHVFQAFGTLIAQSKDAILKIGKFVNEVTIHKDNLPMAKL